MLIGTVCCAEKGMAKLKQRFSLKKQPSQNLAEPGSTPYPMAAGGHHPGNPRAISQGHDQSTALHDEPTAVAAAMAVSEVSAQASGRLSEHRSSDQQQEEAMLERAIKVRHVVHFQFNHHFSKHRSRALSPDAARLQACFAMGQMGGLGSRVYRPWCAHVVTVHMPVSFLALKVATTVSQHAHCHLLNRCGAQHLRTFKCSAYTYAVYFQRAIPTNKQEKSDNHRKTCLTKVH